MAETNSSSEGLQKPIKLSDIKNAKNVCHMKIISNPDAFEEGKELAPSLTCIEAAYLSRAFGKDFLDRPMTLEEFIGAFTSANDDLQTRVNQQKA